MPFPQNAEGRDLKQMDKFIQFFDVELMNREVLLNEFDPWNAYKIVEEDVQSGITAVTAEGAANAPVYHLNGRRAGTSKNFSTLPKGIYIVKGKKVLR